PAKLEGTAGYAKDIRITTREILDDATKADLVRIIEQATDFDAARGDEITFLLGPAVETERPAEAWNAVDRVVSRTAPTLPQRPVTMLDSFWTIMAMAAFATLLAGALAGFVYRHA